MTGEGTSSRPRDDRAIAPSAERNKQPILAVLREALPRRGTVLEIASGTGQHVAHFAAALPALHWQPSEADESLHASIVAWIRHAALRNVDDPLLLDVCRTPWPVARADAIVCVNMIHIAPWPATSALMDGAARLLSPDGPLFLYGPFRREGRHTAVSNEHFDASLRARNPEWGVRDLDEVEHLADEAGLYLDRIVAMPANNFGVLFRKEGGR